MSKQRELDLDGSLAVLRDQIVEMRQAGRSYREIAAAVHWTADHVRAVWRASLFPG